MPRGTARCTLAPGTQWLAGLLEEGLAITLGGPGESIHGNWGFIVRVGIFITLSETLSTSLPGRMLSCPEVYERGFQLGGFNDKQVQFKGEL